MKAIPVTAADIAVRNTVADRTTRGPIPLVQPRKTEPSLVTATIFDISHADARFLERRVPQVANHSKTFCPNRFRGFESAENNNVPNIGFRDRTGLKEDGCRYRMIKNELCLQGTLEKTLPSQKAG